MGGCGCRESDMGSSKWLQTISKCQCEILKNAKGVFLKDQARGGEVEETEGTGKYILYY